MSENNTSKRGELVRTSFVFQLKLMADGMRDLVLVPVSLVATLIGLLKGGDEPDREFKQVIEIRKVSKSALLFHILIGFSLVKFLVLLHGQARVDNLELQSNDELRTDVQLALDIYVASHLLNDVLADA